jgi:hypothetical protein
MPFSRKYSGFAWILAEFPDNLPLDVETFRSSVPISCGLRGIFANLSDIRRVVNVDPKIPEFERFDNPKISTTLK